MEHNMTEYLLTAMHHSKKALFWFETSSNLVIHANLTALELFGDCKGLIDIPRIFSKIQITDYWKNTTEEQLSTFGAYSLYDLSVLTMKNELKMCDFQLCYVDKEKKVFFAEFTFKEDRRMEKAISQIQQSNRAEGICELDENLSLLHYNDKFLDVFDASNQICKEHYGNCLANGFQPEIKDKLLSDIHHQLEIYPSFFHENEGNHLQGGRTLVFFGMPKTYSG